MSDSRVLINVVSQALSRGVIVIVSLFTTAVLARLFGTEGYGNYVFISSFTLLFIGLTDFGTTIVSIREASVKKEEAVKIFGSTFVLRLFLSLTLFLFFNLLVIFLPQFTGLREPALIASLVLPFLVLRTTSQGILQTFLRLDLASFTEVFASIIFLIFLILYYFLFKTASLSLLMTFWALSALFSGFLALFFSSKYLCLKPSWHFSTVKKIFKEAAPLGIYLLVYSVYDRGIDSFIIKTFNGSQAVGFYGLAYKIHGNLILGAAFLMNSLFPLLSSYKQKFDQLKAVYVKAFTILLFSGFFLLISFFVFAPLVINIIGGKEFEPSILVLRILLGATFFSYLNHLTGFFLVALDDQKMLLRFSLVSFLFNLIFNLIFIPRYSYVAAALITILTEIIIFVLTKNYLENKFGLVYNWQIFLQNTKKLFREKDKYFLNF